MDYSRLGLIEEILRLEESGALFLLLEEIKKDIYEEWLVATDEKELIKLHTQLGALDRIEQKVQGMKNELVKETE